MPSPPTADYNLLFGVLALQMDFIDRDALIAAMHAWVLDKNQGLGDILVRQGQLSPARWQLLDALVREHLHAHDNDPQRSLAAVPAASSVRQHLLGLDHDLHASLAGLDAAPAPDPERTVDDLPVGSLRYRVLRPHAKGGLGEVFVAEDRELHREVALKEIQAQHAHDPHSRGRFLLEAEITGGLEHPGIVPVYGLGAYADGRPFYAMRFIKGDNLKEAIERFHQAEVPGRDPGERTLALRQLLRRFVDVCNAVAYAHSRGVVHRDLKPGNVMLGKYGETLVVDWGLAKPVGRSEPAPVSDEPTLRPSSGSAVAATQAGAAVGTPAYMSPEQAAGRLELLGPASDVYSLGATLYCLLTGHAPFEGTDQGEVLRQVQRGAVVPPRRRKSSTPAALEAICLRAMALRPEDRYQSASAVAAEVEHWLADEPVAAYREPLVRWLQRWARRHKTLVAAVAAALLAVVLLGGAGAWWQLRQQAERRAEAARQEWERRQAVEAALEQAGRLMGLAQWAQARALLEQGRLRLGDSGPEDLQQRLQQAEADLNLVERFDAARLQTATLIEGKFDWAEGERLYAAALRESGLGAEGEEAAAVGARLRDSAVRPEVVAALDDWASITENQSRQAWLLAVARAADPDPLRDRLRQSQLGQDRTALARLAEEARAAGLSPQLAVALGRALSRSGGNAVGLLAAAQARFPHDFWLNFLLGVALYEAKQRDEAISYWRAALALRPQASAVHNNLGVALKAKGLLEEAIGHYHQALQVDSKDAQAHYNLGNALQAKDQLDEAIAQYEQALQIDPKLVQAHYNLGNALSAKGLLDEAIRHYQQAIQLAPKHAKAHNNLGNALKAKGLLDEAIRHYHQALQVDPKDAQTHYNLGNALHAKGLLGEAIGHYHQALHFDPKDAEAHGALGQALLAQGRFREARDATRRCLDLLPQGDLQRSLGTRQLQQCEQLLQLEGRLPAILRGDEKPDPPQGLLFADLCGRTKRYAAAARLFADAFASQPRLADDLQAQPRYNAACAAALAAAGQGSEAAQLDAKERARLRQRALDWLRADLTAWAKTTDRAVLQRTLAHWQRDSDLASLRDKDALAKLPEAEREAWRKLWADVADLLHQSGAKP
jgi:serine/threonine protein kinase/Flp pilus assembly protein TadD